MTEDPIIEVLREHEASVKTADLPEARDQRCGPLHLAVEMRGPDGFRRRAVAGNGGREPSAEEAIGGVDARLFGVEELAGKN
ncbi:hypothetical protein ABIC35_002985 [Sphingomonas trueperi]